MFRFWSRNGAYVLEYNQGNTRTLNNSITDRKFNQNSEEFSIDGG
jgi:hypothetical protein